MKKLNKKELKKEYTRQETEIMARINKAIKIFGEKVTPDLDIEKLTRVLNPNNQFEMTTLFKLYNNNKDIPKDIIFQNLEMMKFITLYDDRNNDNGLIICNKPYTDWYIKPSIVERR